MISLKGVSKKFDEESNIVLKDIEFEDGKSYVLLGASGCGKSTLLNMITGVITPDSGKIMIDDTEITAMTQKEKDAFRLKNIGYIFQDFKLMEEMTVYDNLSLLGLGNLDCLPVDEVLDSVGILSKKKSKVKQLSGGEKQRVAIARALMKKPSIIIGDEPTGNLNFENGKNVVSLLMDASRKLAKNVIVVTHDDRLVEFFDEVIHFEDLLKR
ncbi:MAG: ABC transporter ATP-binding protein [Clostridia bacterium]|nr:ABC transporter ATP-binding protein [Clostridia bacterium]